MLWVHFYKDLGNIYKNFDKKNFLYDSWSFPKYPTFWTFKWNMMYSHCYIPITIKMPIFTEHLLCASLRSTTFGRIILFSLHNNIKRKAVLRKLRNRIKKHQSQDSNPNCLPLKPMFIILYYTTYQWTEKSKATKSQENFPV